MTQTPPKSGLFLSLPLFALALLACCPLFARPAGDLLSQEEIETIIRPYLKEEKASGIVVGIVTPQWGQRFYGFGSTRKGGGTKPDEKTLFEIGSISKVFTNLLLEDEVLNNRIHMDDPVTQFLPPGAPFPAPAKSSWSGFRASDKPQPITLWNLATHTSGFPNLPGEGDLPSGYNPKDPTNVTLEMGREFLGHFKLSWEPGVHYDYSSINIALLGYVLSLKEHQEVETLMRQRVLDPLGMTDTRITLSKTQRERLAVGYDHDGAEASFVDTPMAFAAGGSFKSTAADLLKFVAYNLGLVKPNPLAKAMEEQQKPLGYLSGGPTRTISYFTFPHDFGEAYLVRSRTLGFRGCLGFIPEHKIGIVILTNWDDFVVQPVFDELAKWAVGKMGEKTTWKSVASKR
ncbi:MAG TPA: serine hydrolase domain-containing protein [bacterium]|nr:serine hydrolase domain-containing protein [bacterium]